MSAPMSPTEGQILTGRSSTSRCAWKPSPKTGPGTWTLGLVGTRSERFRKVSLGTVELAGVTVLDSGFRYDGDGGLLGLGLQGHAHGIAWELDPYFGLSVSRVDPLPHQQHRIRRVDAATLGDRLRAPAIKADTGYGRGRHHACQAPR